MTELDTFAHRSTPLWRRVWAFVAGGALGVLLGALFATVIAFSLAWMVISLTDLLRQ